MPYSQIAASLCAAAALFCAIPAEARIVCHGEFQVTRQFGEIATPYCEDQHLAAVARCYGTCASGKRIHRNPAAKERVCRLIGNDIRVRDACTNYMPGGNAR